MSDGVSSMRREQARRLLERIGVLRNPCDLDLLMFFVRHPRALLTSDQIAAYIGYDVKHIGNSLDRLLGTTLLTRSPNPSHAARMYVFSVGGSDGGWLPSLIDFMSTRTGRLAMRDALIERAQGTSRAPGDPLDQNQLYRAG